MKNIGEILLIIGVKEYRETAIRVDDDKLTQRLKGEE